RHLRNGRQPAAYVRSLLGRGRRRYRAAERQGRIARRNVQEQRRRLGGTHRDRPAQSLRPPLRRFRRFAAAVLTFGKAHPAGRGLVRRTLDRAAARFSSACAPPSTRETPCYLRRPSLPAAALSHDLCSSRRTERNDTIEVRAIVVAPGGVGEIVNMFTFTTGSEDAI